MDKSVEPLRLGSHRLSSPWILAPMAGVSDIAFRPIALRLGASAAPTELVSAKALVQSHRSQAKVDAMHRHRLQRGEGEGLLWVQLFGAEPKTMGMAAKIVADAGADVLDLNMGCPVRKVRRRGAGAALLDDADRAAKIIEAMAGAGVPVTAKIRFCSVGDGLQIDGPATLALVQKLGDAGAAAVAVHARTMAQAYSGQAHWTALRELVQHGGVAIVANGDAFTPMRARTLLTQTGCAAVMIGRGALGNPWIFEQLSAHSRAGSVAEAPTDAVTDTKVRSGAQRWSDIREHFLRNLRIGTSELAALRRFRQHWLWYLAYFAGAEPLARGLFEYQNPDDVLDAAAKVFDLEALRYPKDPETICFSEKRALG